jgi:hypothetical protein
MPWSLAIALPDPAAGLLAQAAASDPGHSYAAIVALAILLLVFGVGGIILLMFLFVAWRRFNRRQAEKSARPKMMPDLWQESGDRLAERIDRRLRGKDLPREPGDPRMPPPGPDPSPNNDPDADRG